MNNLEKVSQLRDKIYKILTPLIDRDFVYLDVPYHFNAGDTLIWQGTLEFIKNLNYKCHSIAAAGSIVAENAINQCIRQNRIVLLQGGGNFGDLWTLHQRFRKHVISLCRNLSIVILPQTIYYQSEENLKEDSVFFAQYPNVTICVRDKVSLGLAQKYFPNNNPTLVPDMAFCIELEKSLLPIPTKDNIFVKRADKELSTLLDYSIVPADSDISDWPTVSPSHPLRALHKSRLNWCTRIDCRLNTHLRERLENRYWNDEIRRKIVETAISFIGEYKQVYTTRMHAAILAILLNRDKIVLFDNSYGKSSSLADTWFGDLDGFTICRWLQQYAG